MIKVFLLVVEPAATWQRIVDAKRSTLHILLVSLLPLLLLTSLAEGYGLVHWGKVQSNVRYVRQFSTAEAVIFESGQFLVSIIIVFVGAKIIKSLGETFHGRHSYGQTFTLVAYGLSPIFVLRFLDMFPGLNPWVPWIVGMLLTLSVLYNGVPPVMDPDPPHAFGLYVTSALLLVMTSGLMQFVTTWYLQGKFKSLDQIVTDLARHFSSP